MPRTPGAQQPQAKDMYWFAHGGMEPASSIQHPVRSTTPGPGDTEDESSESGSLSWKVNSERRAASEEPSSLKSDQQDGSSLSSASQRSNFSEKRQAVEERKRLLLEAEQERNDAIMKKHSEREAVYEAKRNAQRNNISFAFGSSVFRSSESDGSRVLPSPDAEKPRMPPTSLYNLPPRTADNIMSQSLFLPMGSARGRRKNDLTPTVPYDRTGPPRTAPPSRKRSVSMSRLDQLAQPRRAYIEAQKANSTISNSSSKDARQSPTRPLALAPEKASKQSKSPSTATSVTRRPPTATRKPRPVSIAGTIPDQSPQKPETKSAHQQTIPKNKKAEHSNANVKTHTSQLRASRAKSSSSERTPKSAPPEKQIVSKTPKTKTPSKPPVRHSTPKQAMPPPKAASPKQWTPKTSPARKLLTNKKQAAMLVPTAVDGAANSVGEVAMQPPSPVRSGTPDDDSQSADEKNVSKRIVSEEEAKAALAEKRRLAREQAEKEAELEKQRQEELKRQEEERLRQEEEEHKQMEEEQLRLAEEHRKFEEEKLRKAIEEQERKEEEEKAKKEEETRIKAEQERKAKEEAEKQRIELEEKLRKEEGERAERKKRLEKIMSRTRGKSGTASPGSASGSEAPDSTESQPEILSSEPNSLDSNIAVESLPMDNPPLEEPSGSESLDYNQTMNLDSHSLSSNDLMFPSSGHTSIDSSLPNTVNEGVPTEQLGAEEEITRCLDTTSVGESEEDMSSVTQPVTELVMEKLDSEATVLDTSVVTPAIESSVDALSTENICETPAASKTTVEDSTIKPFIEKSHSEANALPLETAVSTTAVVEEPFSKENVSVVDTAANETSTSEPAIELHMEDPLKVEDVDIKLVAESLVDQIVEPPLLDSVAIDNLNFETTILDNAAEDLDLLPHEEVSSAHVQTNCTEDHVQSSHKEDLPGLVETNFVEDPVIQPSCQEESSIVAETDFVEHSVVQPSDEDLSVVEDSKFVATVVDNSIDGHIVDPPDGDSAPVGDVVKSSVEDDRIVDPPVGNSSPVGNMIKSSIEDDHIVDPPVGNSSPVGDMIKSSIEDDTLVSSIKLDPLNDSVEAELDEINQISEQIAANVEGLIMQSLTENQDTEHPISEVQECADVKESSISIEQTKSFSSQLIEDEKEDTAISSGDEVLIKAEDQGFVEDSAEKSKNELNAVHDALISDDITFTANQSFVAEPEILNDSDLVVEKDDVGIKVDELNLSHAVQDIPYVDPESIQPVILDGTVTNVITDDQNAFDAKVREASSNLEDEENIPHDENNSAHPDTEVLMHDVKNQSFVAPIDPFTIELGQSIKETKEAVQDHFDHQEPLDEVPKEAQLSASGLQDNSLLSGAQDHIDLTKEVTESDMQSNFVEPVVDLAQQLKFSPADPVAEATNIDNENPQFSHSDDLSTSAVPPSEQNISQVGDSSANESELATEDTVNISQSIPVENSASSNPFANTSSNSSHGIEFGGEVNVSLERFADHGVLKTVDEMNFTNLEETNRNTTSFLYSYEEAVPTDVISKEKSEGDLSASSTLDFHQEFSSQDEVHSIINQNLEAGDGDSSLQFGHDFFIGESKLGNSNAENPFEDSAASNICEATGYSDNFTLAQRTFNPFSDTENYTGDADVHFPPSEIISDQVLSPYGESDIGKELLMNALNSAIDESEDSSLDSNLSQVLKVESIDAPISNLDNLNSKTEILDNSLSTIATAQTAVHNEDYSVFPAQENSVVQRTNGYTTTYNNGCLYDDRFESVEYKADQTPVSSKDLDPEHPVSEKGINANNISTVVSGNNTLDNVDNVNSNKIASNPFLVSSDSSQFSGNPFELKEDKTVPT